MATTKFPGIGNSFKTNSQTLLNEASQKMALRSEKELRLPIEDIIRNKFESEVYDFSLGESVADDSLEALALDISKRGIQHAIRVMPAEDGKYEIVSGHRRYAANLIAVNKYGYAEGNFIPCVIESIPPAGRDFEIKERLILDNLQREKTDYERMREIVIYKECVEVRRTLGEDIVSVRDTIKAALGLSDATITRFLKVSTSLIPSLMEAFHEGKIAATVAYEIACLPSDEQSRISEKWNKEDEPTLTLSRVSQILHTQESAPAKRTPAVRKPVIRYKKIGPGISDLKARIQRVEVLSEEMASTLDSVTRNHVLKELSKQNAAMQTLLDELEQFRIPAATVGEEQHE